MKHDGALFGFHMFLQSGHHSSSGVMVMQRTRTSPLPPVKRMVLVLPGLNRQVKSA